MLHPVFSVAFGCSFHSTDILLVPHQKTVRHLFYKLAKMEWERLGLVIFPDRQLTMVCSMKSKTQSFHRLYQQLFAWGMAKASAADEDAIRLVGCNDYSTLAQLKQSLFADVQGKVLEIGPGAGVNLEYYPANVHWIGIEPNPFMHSYLEQEAARQELRMIEIKGGSAARIEVEDSSIDAVVSTYVLCSVSNLAAVLQEVRRVLKPGGRFLFVEHVAAECGTWKRRLQDGIEPVWKRVFDGCHPNRETWQALENAGFENLNYQHFQVSFPIVSPHIAGVATNTKLLFKP